MLAEGKGHETDLLKYVKTFKTFSFGVRLFCDVALLVETMELAFNVLSCLVGVLSGVAVLAQTLKLFFLKLCKCVFNE